jgi:hypothetical protein
VLWVEVEVKPYSTGVVATVFNPQSLSFESLSFESLSTYPLLGEKVKVNVHPRVRQSLMALVLLCVLAFSTACSGVSTQSPQANQPALNRSVEYGQLARGSSAVGQEFGDWVVQASQGLIKDAFVRDNNKLGVVISSQVRPDEVKALAQSLAQGFRKNFSNQDLDVLIYAPDKQLILTARYDAQSKQIEYQSAG